VKNKGSLLVLAIFVIFFTGCAVRTGGYGGSISSFSLTPPLLTVVLTNNTNVPLEVLENGVLVGVKDSTGQYHDVVLNPGDTISRGYYNFMGSRDLIITVRGTCPPVVEVSCSKPGQYAGTDYRQFTIYTDGRYHTESWQINYLRGPRGVY